MAEAEVASSGDVIEVVTDYVERDLIRSVPGSRWNPNTRHWTTPLSWGSCLALRGVFEDRLTLGPRLTEWAWRERAERVDPASALRSAVEVDVSYHESLYPFQQAGVAWLVTAGCAALTDEMGTGKTAQTVVATRVNHETRDPAFPVCVIAPNSVTGTWRREWNYWDPRATVFVLPKGAAKKRKLLQEVHEAHEAGDQVVLILNVEAARLHTRLAPYGDIELKKCTECGGQSEKVKTSQCEVHRKELNAIPWRTVIVDEAHRTKDPKSKQTRAVWTVQHTKTVTYRYSLTGTPIANHPGELWPLMHGVAPEDYPTKTKYVDRYCLQGWNPFGGLDIIGVRPDTRDEFYSILNPRMRRMPKQLVLPYLPPKLRQMRQVDMSPKQAKAYREIDDRMVTRLDDGSVLLATNNLAQNTRLLQFSSAFVNVLEDGEVELSEPSPKLDVMDEIIEELDGAGVVFAAESRQLIELAASRLDKRGIAYRKIVGGMTQEQREQAITDFQSEYASVMLMTLKAGGVGLTLTRAGVIVFLQRSWSMIDNKQAEDRVHRIGSERHDNVLVIDVVTNDTVEEDQIPKLHEKLQRHQEIVRDREVLLANGEHEAVARLDEELAQIEQTPICPTKQEEAVA